MSSSVRCRSVCILSAVIESISEPALGLGVGGVADSRDNVAFEDAMNSSLYPALAAVADVDGFALREHGEIALNHSLPTLAAASIGRDSHVVGELEHFL